ncbi:MULTISPECIES: HD-GYP domain-containing protein [Paenibacillus]|uniref:HD-GYP domain-containing protein n=1 Tax=Paenibacillus TaxID=44249 RepID=UPI0022B93AD9|nr:HD-GYP domain-containing protein [Paenibacillus caseinilyticus]MCZ8522095.1 HD-GYP domain-containing protein [Paenibacillus caseinilyticus]
MIYRPWFGPAAAMLLPYLLFEAVRRSPDLDTELPMPHGHFYIVSSVSLLAALIAVAVWAAGLRMRNIQVNFLALSFLSLAGVFSVHGLSTPNLLLGITHLPGVTAPLSVALATGWLWMSSLPGDHASVRLLSRFQGILLPLWTAFLLVCGTFGMMHPHLIDVLPLNVHPFNILAAVLVTLFNGITMFRYYRSYLYSRFPLQLAIVYSCGWLVGSQWIMVLGEPWRLSWWMYHFLLLASMFAMVCGLLKQYTASSQSLVGAVRSLFTNDPVERITSALSPSVKALMVATEKKDSYTAGHNFRVTLYAIQLAQELKLGPDLLRAVAQGTIIHDVGKIHVPDDILGKPGRLTPEERLVIETHPVKGYDMCRSLGFRLEELQVIRSHHEKWDGSGYPDRLQREEIPLLARIVAVADVYDALTSQRAYRQAMSHAEALCFLRQNSGSHFDPQCIAAWESLCSRHPERYPYTAEVPSGKPAPVVRYNEYTPAAR